jgi:predicted molibdopterin-dependent oxidoreductase YjgC
MRIENHPVLKFEHGRRVRFTLDGEELFGYEGEPISAALHDSGVRVLRYSIKEKRPRGFFCAIGNCSSCLMVVDGVPNTRVCVTPLREGMVIRRQHDKGHLLVEGGGA